MCVLSIVWSAEFQAQREVLQVWHSQIWWANTLVLFCPIITSLNHGGFSVKGFFFLLWPTFQQKLSRSYHLVAVWTSWWLCRGVKSAKAFYPSRNHTKCQQPYLRSLWPRCLNHVQRMLMTVSMGFVSERRVAGMQLQSGLTQVKFIIVFQGTLQIVACWELPVRLWPHHRIANARVAWARQPWQTSLQYGLPMYAGHVLGIRQKYCYDSGMKSFFFLLYLFIY